MRLVLDLQAVQGGNKSRGIGRYALALAQAMARRRGDCDLLIALNGAMPTAIDPLRRAFRGLLPSSSIRMWHGLQGASALDPANTWRRQASEHVREAFLASLRPDIVHCASVFEGFEDDAVASICRFAGGFHTAATLYDLIPLAHSAIYLRHPRLEAWYRRQLAQLQRAELWLAISEHSRREAIELLGLPADRVVAIAGAADDCFRPVQLSQDRVAALRTRYGLPGRFVMYTGGIDHRKNIDGLLRAYALLSAELRSEHPLLIVCKVEPAAREHLKQLAASYGLGQRDVILSGYVADEDLVALYNLARAFVFPSWHEGLGLPVLEAMACGTAAIASDCSSLPEVIGRPDALFDPHDPRSIARKLTHVLSDAGFRDALRVHGLKQSATFSWDRSARVALEALDEFHARRRREPRPVLPPEQALHRPRLVMVAPLPPERSGIADYTADLLPALARHYDIDVVVDQDKVEAPAVEATCRVRSLQWFAANARDCGRIVYQFGNSHFHKHMLDLLVQHPGIVVLHDFFLSGLYFHLEACGLTPGAWSQALYDSHGYPALAARFAEQDAHRTMGRYPVNLPVLRDAEGVIVHSEHARELATYWYGPNMSASWIVVPQPRALEPVLGRASARRRLGVAESDFLVCSFGILAASKLNHRLLQAWLQSTLHTDPRCRLVFVGDHNGSEYGARILKTARKAGVADRVRITGFCGSDDYRQWLAAADMAVQLRQATRGETSRAVLDCMGASLPLVVNAHGTMRDFPVAVQLPDAFADKELAAALEALRHDKLRLRMEGDRARAHFRGRHAPRVAAEGYAAAIEQLHAAARGGRRDLTTALAALEDAPSDAQSWIALARATTRSLPPLRSARQILVDVTQLSYPSGAGDRRRRSTEDQLRGLLGAARDDLRLEPVVSVEDGGLLYARAFACRVLDLPARLLADEAVEPRAGDAYLGWACEPDRSSRRRLRGLRRAGGRAYLLIEDAAARPGQTAARTLRSTLTRLLPQLGDFDAVLCTTRVTAIGLLDLLDTEQPDIQDPLDIGFLEDSGPALGARAGDTDLLRAVEMIEDAGHRNWLARWRPGAPQAAATAARVA